MMNYEANKWIKSLIGEMRTDSYPSLSFSKRSGIVKRNLFSRELLMSILLNLSILNERRIPHAG